MADIITIGDHRRTQVTLVERSIASVYDALPAAVVDDVLVGALVDFDDTTSLVDFDDTTPLIDFL